MGGGSVGVEALVSLVWLLLVMVASVVMLASVLVLVLLFVCRGRGGGGGGFVAVVVVPVVMAVAFVIVLVVMVAAAVVVTVVVVVVVARRAQGRRARKREVGGALIGVDREANGAAAEMVGAAKIAVTNLVQWTSNGVTRACDYSRVVVCHLVMMVNIDNVGE